MNIMVLRCNVIFVDFIKFLLVQHCWINMQRIYSWKQFCHNENAWKAIHGYNIRRGIPVACMEYNGYLENTQPFLLFSCHSLYCSVFEITISLACQWICMRRSRSTHALLLSITEIYMKMWKRWWYVTQNWISIRWSNEF